MKLKKKCWIATLFVLCLIELNSPRYCHAMLSILDQKQLYTVLEYQLSPETILEQIVKRSQIRSKVQLKKMVLLSSRLNHSLGLLKALKSSANGRPERIKKVQDFTEVVQSTKAAIDDTIKTQLPSYQIIQPLETESIAEPMAILNPESEATLEKIGKLKALAKTENWFKKKEVKTSIKKFLTVCQNTPAKSVEDEQFQGRLLIELHQASDRFPDLKREILDEILSWQLLIRVSSVYRYLAPLIPQDATVRSIYLQALTHSEFHNMIEDKSNWTGAIREILRYSQGDSELQIAVLEKAKILNSSWPLLICFLQAAHLDGLTLESEALPLFEKLLSGLQRSPKGGRDDDEGVEVALLNLYLYLEVMK